jgi:hypothetical protein
MRILLEVLLTLVPGLGDALKKREAPRVPLPPKYDFVIRRKEGIQFASETDLKGLRFWRDIYETGAKNEQNEHRDKDAKRVENIDRWIGYRECFPSENWSGKRDKTDVTARAPCGKPKLYPKPPNKRGAGGGTTTTQTGAGADPDSEDFDPFK